MDQSCTPDDSPSESGYSENLLFSQAGYQLNDNASFALGYIHDWIHLLDKTAYQESRPYQDFVWNPNIDGFKFTSRTRMEERIGDTGYRPRQD